MNKWDIKQWNNDQVSIFVIYSRNNEESRLRVQKHEHGITQQRAQLGDMAAREYKGARKVQKDQWQVSDATAFAEP